MTYPRNIPISIPALIKRIKYPVQGLCATKLKKKDLDNVRIVLMDIHWFFSLKGAFDLVRYIRSKDQNIIIIAGGISATEYPRMLIDQIGVDYVIRGDGEMPLPLLVHHLIESDKKPDHIPNLVGRDGFNTLYSVKPYCLNRTDFSENEFYDIDFFPYMKQELMSLHKRNPGMPPFIYPFLLPFRGCPIHCDFCAGAPNEQKKVFKRSVVFRDPERLAYDIETLGKTEWIQFVNCLLDFITLVKDEYSQTALKNPSRLKTQYEFTKAPTMDQLDFLLSRFNGGTIHFSADVMHLTSDRCEDPAVLIKLIERAKKDTRYVPVLDFSSVYVHSNPDYRQTVLDVTRHTNCLVYDGSIWWSDFPKPDANGFASEEEFAYFFKNAITPKHFIANRLNEMINFLDIILPNSMSLSMRRAYYRYYHRMPLMVKYGRQNVKPALKP